MRTLDTLERLLALATDPEIRDSLEDEIDFVSSL